MRWTTINKIQYFLSNKLIKIVLYLPIVKLIIVVLFNLEELTYFKCLFVNIAVNLICVYILIFMAYISTINALKRSPNFEELRIKFIAKAEIRGIGYDSAVKKALDAIDSTDQKFGITKFAYMTILASLCLIYLAFGMVIITYEQICDFLVV